jgi:hypothetical protein
MSEEVKKQRGRDPEFMKAMREKAAAKKAEQKKIKEAQKLKEKQQHEEKLMEAEKVLNPVKKPVEKPVEKTNNFEDEPKTPSKQKEINYKQEYYKAKLERMKEGKPTPEANPIEHHKPLPHKLLKAEFMNDVNKTVMKELWKRHFKNDVTPYD